MPSYREDAYRDKLKEQVLRLDSIDNIKPISNSVLVLIEEMHDEITHGTLTLKLDTSFEVGKHAPNKGTVIRVPEKFVYSKKASLNTGDWDTDIEIEEGDLVWFDYLTGLECNKVECKGKLYYILPYYTLYVAKKIIKGGFEWSDEGDGRSSVNFKKGKGPFNVEKIIPLNGYILCEPIINTEKYIDFEFEREEAKYAMVAYVGSCNKKYRGFRYHDDPAVQVGCKVIYGMATNLWLEQEEHSSFNGKKRYRITQRRYLTGIIET